MEKLLNFSKLQVPLLGNKGGNAGLEGIDNIYMATGLDSQSVAATTVDQIVIIFVLLVMTFHLLNVCGGKEWMITQNNGDFHN